MKNLEMFEMNSTSLSTIYGGKDKPTGPLVPGGCSDTYCDNDGDGKLGGAEDTIEQSC